MIYRSRYSGFDIALLLLSLVIFSVGLLSIYSATHTEEAAFAKNLVTKQLIWMAVSLLMLLIILKFDYQNYINLAYPLYIITAIFLILVLVIGRTKFGASRWFSLGGFTFQPSEFAKLVLILVLASYLGRRRAEELAITDIAVSLLLTFPFIYLIAVEPDLGTAIVLLAILVSMLYVGRARVRHLVFLIGSAVISTPLLWHVLRDYQKQRLLVFLNPNADPLGAGYTIIQSKIAIGSGSFLGKGWLSGTQNQLNFLPERHTDFIFSVVGEEWGFLGSLFLILLYFVFMQRALSITSSTSDPYARLIATGVITMLTFQIFVNIAMTLGFMPVVGLPLPLMSYGGSSLITTMASIALLLNIGMKRTIF